MGDNMLEFAVKMSMVFNNSGMQGFNQATAQMQKMQNEFDRLRQASGKIGEYQKLRGTIDQTAQRLNAARERVRVLKEQMKQTPQPTAAMKREFTQANVEANRLSQTLMTQRKNLGELGRSLTDAGVNTRKLESEQARLASQTDKLKAAQDKLTQSRNKLNAIKQNLSWDNMKGTYMQLAATYGVIKPMVKISGDFEEAMQKVKAVGFSSEGADLTKFEEMKAQSLKLGAETSFTAIQAANSQENLIRAGFTPDETMKAMPGLLNMAAAEGLDLAQAASIIAGSIRSIGLEAKDAEYISDLFAFASANSATNITNIGEAFAGTAGTARGLKVEADQLTAMLMSLANQQVESSQAGTAMSSTFMRLSKEPKAVADALSRYNVAVMTRNGDMRELPDILAELYRNTEKFGSKAQIGAFANVFGTNFGDSMFKLAQASLPGKDGGLSEYEKNLKGLREKSKGQSQRMTDINLDSLNGQLTILGSAVDGVKIALGDMFNPIVRKGVEMLTNALSKLNDILVEFPNASKGVVLTLSAFAGMKTINGIMNIGKSILSLPGAWLEFMNATRAVPSVVSTAMTASASATGGLGSAISGLLGPLGLVALAIGALVYYWDDVTAACERAGEVIKNIDRTTPTAELAKKADRTDYYIRAMEMTYAPPGTYEAHATGGIMTRPHVGLVAESGPEAIVPLRDKARGQEVLKQAAGILGVPLNENVMNEAGTITTQTGGNIYELGGGIPRVTGYSSVNDVADRSSNVINIQVDGRNMDDMKLAERIAESVRNVLNEIAGENVRLNYA